jgi:integrase
VVRMVWNHVADTVPDLGPNPVRLRKNWFPVSRRTRHVNGDQLPAFYEATMQLDDQIARDLILTLMYTGMRFGECATLTWDDVDFTSRTIRIAASRMKAGKALALPMVDAVRDVLVARRRIGKAKFVFPGNTKEGYATDIRHAFAAIVDATGIKVSPHDLRRSYISIASTCLISPFELKMLVAHSTGSDVTAGYVMVGPEQLRTAAQKVADRIKELCQVSLEGGNVERLKR